MISQPNRPFIRRGTPTERRAAWAYQAGYDGRQARDWAVLDNPFDIESRPGLWHAWQAGWNDRADWECESIECAQILAGEISRFIDLTDGSHP